MIRRGHILLKLCPGYETRAPSHLDVLDGTQRVAGTIDGRGPVDRAVLVRTSGMRAQRCFHAAASLHEPGIRHVHFSDTEHALGLDLVISLELAEPEALDAVVSELRLLDQVEWAMAEPLATVPFRARPPREQAAQSWDAFEHVGAARALEIEPGSRAISVAVIDTGVMLEHPEFQGKLRAGYDTVDLGMGWIGDGVRLIGDSHGRDFCPRDETGHGSHVAAIIGARGLAMAPGIGGQATVLPVRALAAASAGEGAVFGVGGLADIDAAIKVAVDMNAKVLNMSFGTARNLLDAHSPAPHSDALAYAEAHGCIAVAAMGNSGEAEEYFPAALPQCIAVGSMNLDGQRSEFSTTGRHIALCAPGENVLSAGMEGYAESTGTSHAAPIVAGAAALLAARAAARGHDLTCAEAREALCLSADGGTPNPETGWGMLNIPAALSHLGRMELQDRKDRA